MLVGPSRDPLKSCVKYTSELLLQGMETGDIYHFLLITVTTRCTNFLLLKGLHMCQRSGIDTCRKPTWWWLRNPGQKAWDTQYSWGKVLSDYTCAQLTAIVKTGIEKVSQKPSDRKSISDCQGPVDRMRGLTTNAWSSFGNVLYCECADGYITVYTLQNLPNCILKLVILIININYNYY